MEDLDKGHIVAIATAFPKINQMQWMIEARQAAKARGDRLMEMDADMQPVWKMLVREDRLEMLVRRAQFLRVVPKCIKVRFLASLGTFSTVPERRLWPQVWRAWVAQAKKERFAWWVGTKPLVRRCYLRLRQHAIHAKHEREIENRLNAADAKRIRDKLQEKRDWIQRMNERWKKDEEWRRKGVRQGTRLAKAFKKRTEALRVWQLERTKKLLHELHTRDEMNVRINQFLDAKVCLCSEHVTQSPV